MKKIIFAVSIILIAAGANAQQLKEADVPSAVKNSFTEMYPDINNFKWEKEEGKFEAEFKLNNVETSVLFDANGTYIQKEVEISTSELPAGVKNYASTNLSGKKIEEASKIVDSKGTVIYKAEIGKQDYLFDQSGNFLKKESDENEQDDNNK